jgi:hypothetical protein
MGRNQKEEPEGPQYRQGAEGETRRSPSIHLEVARWQTMKNPTLRAFAGVALFILTGNECPVFSQSTQNQDRTLEINGARLTLGMDQSQVFAKLRDANLLIMDTGSQIAAPGGFICGSTDKNCSTVLGSFTFTDGRLSVITKRWADNSKTIPDLLTAFYGVAVDFENRGLGQCRIAAKQDLRPNIDSRSVNLFCGPYRRLSVSLNKTPSSPYIAMIEEVVSLIPQK